MYNVTDLRRNTIRMEDTVLLSAYVQFHKQFIQNKFGYDFKICDTLWFEGNLNNLIRDSVEFVRTFHQYVFTSAVRY
jgi:hypothetical protein